MTGEDFDIHLFAALQRDGQARIVVAVEESQRRRFDRGDKNRDRAGGQLPQCGCTLLLHIGMRRKVFKRKDVVGGQTHNSRGVNGSCQLAAGLEQWLQCLGRLVVGDHNNHRLAGGPRHQRDVKRPRCRRQSGDTPPPRTKAQMPSYAFKSRRVLQLRKDFADKRENHVVLVYQPRQPAQRLSVNWPTTVCKPIERLDRSTQARAVSAA